MANRLVLELVAGANPRMKTLESVQSNSFSIGQIVTTWTSGLANAVVNGWKFVEQVWKSTQMVMLRGLLNFWIQKLAALAIQASVELAIVPATAASAIGITAAKNAAIVAGDVVAATATTSIWAGAAAGIVGTFGALTGAITGFFTITILPFFAAIGEALMVFLSSIAAAAGDRPRSFWNWMGGRSDDSSLIRCSQ